MTKPVIVSKPVTTTDYVDMTDAMVEAMAQSAHEVARAALMYLGDHTQFAWEPCAESTKQLVRQTVRAMFPSAEQPASMPTLYGREAVDWLFAATVSTLASTLKVPPPPPPPPPPPFLK